MNIIDKVRNQMYQEPFSENSPMLESYKQLEINGMKKAKHLS